MGSATLCSVSCTSIATVVSTRVLKPYQQQRLVSFLNPEADPVRSGYQLIQSKVAIGSGGLFGKGFAAGTQKRLAFLPAQHTDFISARFATVEEGEPKCRTSAGRRT